ncbi:MAG: hypothetical protein JSV38_10940, partial [Desulfobacterales bacterium]
MKTPTFKTSLFWMLPIIIFVFSGWNAYSRQGGVAEIYKDANTPFDDEKSVNAALALPVKSVLVKTHYQGGRFWTEARKDKIERFKCSKCHNNKAVTLVKAAEIAHGDIALDHGGQVKP